GALGGVAAFLPAARGMTVAFLSAASISWGITVRQVWQSQREPETAPETQRLGAATAVTLFRAWLIAVVAGHLFLAPATGANGFVVGVIYSIAAILDGVDGRIARDHAQVTRLGSRLDVATDVLGLLVAPIVAVRAEGLPPWYLVLALAYPVMRAGLALRTRLGLPVFLERLGPNPRARLFAGIQMGVVATALFPVLPRWLLWSAATIAMVPTLLLFLREWRLATEAAPPLPLPVQAPSRGV
ncbi:MAG TPA: CDP-alcohol phosphatidyltransferase family protein, partial [Polyangia bacterium]